jgi:hypothetical protein
MRREFLIAVCRDTTLLGIFNIFKGVGCFLSWDGHGILLKSL